MADWLSYTFATFVKDTSEYAKDKCQKQHCLVLEDVESTEMTVFERKFQNVNLYANNVTNSYINSVQESKILSEHKSFRNCLSSTVTEAGKAIVNVSAKIKATIEQNSIFQEFSKEQETFLKSQKFSSMANIFPPWLGCPDEENVKAECLNLSNDRRNFVRGPPPGIDFDFDYDIYYPIAISVMKEAPGLANMRFELVPKIVSEKNFWKNYFYRVSLICKARETLFLAQDDQPVIKEVTDLSSDTFLVNALKKPDVLSRKTREEDWEKELEEELSNYEIKEEEILKEIP